MGKEYRISSDTLLWHDFTQGSDEALCLIYNTYLQSLFRYGCNLTFDEEMIKDCIHDVFVDLLKYRSALSPTNNIKLYLYKSLKRKIFLALQKNIVFGILEPEKLSFLYRLSSEDELIDAELDQQRHQIIVKAMSKISPRQKEAIYLKYVSELGYNEISKVMKMNYQSARNLVSRGLEKLRVTSCHK